MADETPKPQSKPKIESPIESTNNLPVRRFPLGIVLLGVLIVFFVIMMIAVLLLWQQTASHHQQLRDEFINKLNAQQADNHLRINRLQQQVTYQAQLISQQQHFISNLQQNVNQLKAPIKMQQDWQKLNAILFQLNLSQNYLMAGIINLPIAIEWVHHASQEIQLMDNSNNPELANAQQALVKLDQALKKIKPLNITKINQSLAEVNGYIRQLITRENTNNGTKGKENKSSNGTVNSQNSSWLSQQWYSLRNSLNQLVVISHRNTSVLPLSLRDKQLVQAKLTIYLLEARWALLQQNQTLYLYSLNQCHDLILANFPEPSEERALALADLEKLKQINLQPALPTFLPAINALNGAKESLEKFKVLTQPALNAHVRSITILPASPTELNHQQNNSNQQKQPNREEQDKTLKNVPKEKPQNNTGVEI